MTLSADLVSNIKTLQLRYVNHTRDTRRAAGEQYTTVSTKTMIDDEMMCRPHRLDAVASSHMLANRPGQLDYVNQSQSAIHLPRFLLNTNNTYTRRRSESLLLLCAYCIFKVYVYGSHRAISVVYRRVTFGTESGTHILFQHFLDIS